MYFLSFQYVKELDPDKSELAENNGIEPLLSRSIPGCSSIELIHHNIFKNCFSFSGTGGE